MIIRCIQKYFLGVLLVLSNLCVSQTPNWNWSSGWAGADTDLGRGVYVDSLGNTYQVGSFSSASISLPTLGTLSNSGAVGTSDIMIAKFDKFGTPLWQVKAGGSGDDIAYCVTADRDGNVYVGGSSHSSSCVFYGSTNVTLTAGSSTDIFTAKFNSSGQVLWVETASGSATDEVLSITADKDYIYVAGYFSNVLTFPSSGSLNSTGGEDMFLVKYDLDGNIIWTKKEGGTGNDRCTGITNNKTDLFIAGYATNGITYNGSPTITKTSVGLGGQDITFAKIDKDGDPVWAKIEGNSSNCAANSITVLKGKVIVGGYFFGSMIYNSISLIVPGTANNMIFAEYNLDGTFNILRLTATAGDEFVQSLTSDSRYFYVSGKYANNTDFGGTSSVSSSSNNMFIACYDTLFNLKFVKLSTGSSVSQVLSCSANQNGMVSTTGTYNGSSIQFAPLAIQANSNLEDFYVANFNACFPISTNTIASSQTVCIGSSVANLTGSVPTGGNDSYTYLWQNSSDGITWTNAAGTNTLVNYNVPSITSNTYFKRIVYSCSEVSSSNQVTITIVPNPTVSIISSSSTLCSGSTITLTASGASSYTWTSGPSTSSYTINTAGVYTVIGSNSNGCVDSKTINISASPIPTINAIANPTVICMGGTSTLTSSGASTYTWSSGAVSSTVSINTAGIYTVTGTNASGCSSTQTVSLFVNANPTVTAVSSSTAICAGSTATLVAGGATTYTWSSGPTTSTYTTSSAGIYTVTGTDGNNCADTKTVSLVVNALPVVTAVSSSSAICSGKSATLTASGASTYTWTSGPTNSTYTTSTAGIYTVTGTDGNFCANASTVSLVVNASPTVSVNSGTICSGNSFTILPTGASTYTYSSGTNIVSPATLTSYSITGSNVFGCISTNTAISSVDVMVCTPAEAINFDGIDDHIIIPKPISTDFTIEYWMKTTQTGPTAAQWWGGNGIVDADSPIAGSSDFGTSLTGSKLAFGIGIPDVTIKSTSNVNTGSWIHIAVTWKQTTGEMKLYVNGILENTGISNTTPRTFPTRMTVGSRQNAVGFYNGYIDELRLWTKVRTQCEINTFKNCEIPTNDVGLVSNYHFNQGYNSAPNYSVTNLFDASGSANTGTLTNMALAGPTSNWISPGSVVSGFSTPSNYTPTISTIVSNSVVCYGNTSTLSGTGASTYSWTSSVINGVAFTPTLTNTYTVIGTSTQGCTNTAIASVTVNNTPTITASNGTICAGYSYTILPTGAISYTYSGGSNIVSPIVTSVYTVTGNNALGCTSTKTVSLIVNPNPTVTAVSSSSAICAGETATLTAGGANTYTWTSGPSTSSYSVITAGIYTVTGTDLNLCINTQTVGLIVNSNPTVTAVSSSSAICAGDTATLTAGGASTYTWTSGPSTSSYSVITAGVYTVTGTDLNLCINTQTVDLIVNSNPTVTAVSSSSAICAGETATLTAGGASTYTWASGPSTSSYSVTTAGVYTVTGTDINSCINTQTVDLIVNSNPTVTAVSSSSAICAGETATLTAGGASTYTWTSGPSTSSYSVITAGIYTVTGTDLNSCTNTQTVGLIVNSNPTITAVSSSSAICAGETAILTAGGASTYTWTSGPSTSSYSVTTAGIYTVTGTDLNSCINTQTVGLIVNSNPTVTAVSSSSAICSGQTATLTAGGASTYTWTSGPSTSSYSVTTAGIYTVTGTDLNSCTNTQTVSLVVNSNPTVTAVSSSSTICSGQTATLTAGGANTYTWTSGPSTSSYSVTTAGVYTVTGTDLNSCINTQTVGLIVNSNPTLTAVSSSSAICAGQTATLTAGGASTYTWSSGSSTSSYSVTTAGIYTVTGTDLNLCINTQTVDLIVNSNPTVTAVSSSSAICSGQTATLTAGGASTYTWISGPSTSSYSVTTAGIYTVTGTDLNSCINTQTVDLIVNSNPTITAVSSSSAICAGETATLTAGGTSTYTWTSGPSTSSYSVTIAGIYTVTGTDLNSCINTQTVDLIVNSNPTITAVSSSSAICAGETATLTAGGASTYTWTSGPSTSSYSVITAGIYTVTGTDLNLCINTQTVDLIVNSNPTITAVSSSSVICSGQTATLTAGGASTYTWTSGPSTSSYSVTTAGVYTVTGTDINSCINTQTVDLIVNSNPTVTAVSSSSAICADGTATLTAGGAITYTWTSGPSTPIYSVNTAGIYTVTGTDLNLCINTQTVDLIVNSNPTVTAVSSSSVICADATATLSATGATSYFWVFGPATSTYIVNTAGVYTVVGTDVNSCISSQTVTIVVNSLPNIMLNSGAICIGNSFTLNPSGALSYTIMGGAGTSLIVNPTSTTTYTIEGTDINGCVNSQTTEVTVNMLPTVANAGEDIFVSAPQVDLNGNTPLIGVGSWAVLSGDGTLQNSNLNNSNFYNLSQGEHVLVWQISNLNCPTSYDTLLVYRKETLFPELITPNNDGNNDYLYFNLAEYNSNLTIEVFNRWGKTVYKNSDYKNEFNGISLSGEELPEDTYFVILADTEKKIYSGYFLLKRK